MFRKVSLSVLAIAASGIAAAAADLPVRSQIGAIFAEPAEAPPPVVYHYVEIPAPIITYTNLPDPVWNRGNYNYGSSWSWYNCGATIQMRIPSRLSRHIQPRSLLRWALLRRGRPSTLCMRSLRILLLVPIFSSRRLLSIDTKLLAR